MKNSITRKPIYYDDFTRCLEKDAEEIIKRMVDQKKKIIQCPFNDEKEETTTSKQQQQWGNVEPNSARVGESVVGTSEEVGEPSMVGDMLHKTVFQRAGTIHLPEEPRSKRPRVETSINVSLRYSSNEY